MTFLLQLSQCIIHRIFLVSYYRLWFLASKSIKFFENEFKSFNSLWIGYYYSKDSYALTIISSCKYSSLVFFVMLWLFFDNAESQVKSYRLAKFIIVLFHLRGHHDQNVGYMWIVLVYIMNGVCPWLKFFKLWD